MPTSEAPLPRAIPGPAAMATRNPVNEPGPVATAIRSTDARAVRVDSKRRSIAPKSSSPCLRCARQVSSPRTSRPSKSATEAHSVEVSSANNTRAKLPHERGGSRPGRLDDDPPFGVRDGLEPDVEAVVGQRRAGSVRPLDDRHSARLETLLPPGVREAGAFEAVEIDVKEGQTTAEALAKDDERRARHVAGVDPEADRDPPRKHGLPGSELTPEREHVVRPGRPPEPLPEPLGVERGVAHQIERRSLTRIGHSPLLSEICGAQGRAES